MDEPGFMMEADSSHVVLVDVSEDKPPRVLLTIVTAGERKPLAYIKLTPPVAMHVSKLLNDAAISAAYANPALKIVMPQHETSKENEK